MSETAIYWLAFSSYSLLVIGIGWRIFRKERRAHKEWDNTEYWAASQSLSGWSIGLSISASMMSISWSGVYGVQLFYWYGIGGAWLLIIPWLITMAGFFIFAPFFRKFGAFSQPELLEKRFGKHARQLIAPALIFVFTVWGGAEIYAAGITISPFLKIPLPATLFLIALIVAIYSYTGGFRAVVSTDKLQFALVAIFMTAIAGIGLYAVYQNHSLHSLFQITKMAPKSMNHKPWYVSPGVALIAITFFAYLPGWLVETDVWIRLQAAQNNREARKGVLLASLNSLIFVGIFPLIIGLAALILYPPVGGQIPTKLHDGTLIFSNIMSDFSPFWLNVILSIGLISAAMSTIDTCGNVVALSLSYDVLEPSLKNRLTAPRLNKFARRVSVFAILLAFGYAIFIQSLWDIFYLSSGILTTTVLPAMLISFMRKTNVRQLYLTIFFGFWGTFLFYYLESRGYLQGVEPDILQETGLGYIIYGFLLSVMGFILGYRKQRFVKST